MFKANPLSREYNYYNSTQVNIQSGIVSAAREPNTALMTVILLFGTFCVAFYMQKVRHSHFFGKQVMKTIACDVLYLFDVSLVIIVTTMTIMTITITTRCTTMILLYYHDIFPHFITWLLQHLFVIIISIKITYYKHFH